MIKYFNFEAERFMKKRPMYFSGTFYPSKEEEIHATINRYTHILEGTPEGIWRLDMMVTYAVIVPHDCWENSGFTANIAYRVLAGSMLDTVVVITPALQSDFVGIRVTKTDTIETPMGELEVDQTLINYLEEHYGVTAWESSEYEQTSEVQFPFIHYYMPNTKVVELVCGHTNVESIESILSYLLQYQKYGVVICSDLSRSHTMDKANQTDAVCLLAVENENVYTLHEGCEGTNLTAIEAMLLVAQSMDLKSSLLDYRTSADATGNTDQVIGYMSALFQDKLF